MSPSDAPLFSEADDPRVLEAAREYLADLESGRRPDREAWLERHRDIAGPLAECLDGIELAQSLRPDAAADPGAAGEPLGDYRIVRELGRGGMGIVYEAVQLSLGRRVALKVLPFFAALDARHLQRFKTEAQAAAQLHHSNIVPVHAVGCERGVHFYAMQLIEGRTLEETIRDLRAEAAAGSPAPHGRTRHRRVAEIGAAVADALDYAHESGVVHRDIKPANLLLDGAGRVWVTDFGLAQVAADVTLTQTGSLVGTLRYMSPEQASGRRGIVDHRTDIYSLGATLYELLTLEPIFAAQDRQALLRDILEVEPRPPRRLVPAVPVELETILMKALAKNPGERYATARELAADLRRFLEARPILARRPTVWDHARKWMRRHPAAIGAALLVLAVGVAALSVVTARIAREQGNTAAALDRERERTLQAEERLQLARRAADDMILIAEDELANSPMFESLRKRLLSRALAHYQDIIEETGEDVGARAELSATRDRVRGVIADIAALEGDRNAMILKEEAVLDDLDVSPEQRLRIRALVADFDRKRAEGMGDPHEVPADERLRRMIEQARANEAAVLGVLEPAQAKRLRQIALQCQGPGALLVYEVRTALRLSQEQRGQIQTLESQLFGGPGGPGGPGGRRPGPRDPAFGGRSPGEHEGEPDGWRGPPPDGPRGSRPPERAPGEPGGFGPPDFGPRSDASREAVLRKTMTEALAVLNEEQRKQWWDIAGDPYVGPFPRMMGGPGRDRGR